MESSFNFSRLPYEEVIILYWLVTTQTSFHLFSNIFFVLTQAEKKNYHYIIFMNFTIINIIVVIMHYYYSCYR